MMLFQTKGPPLVKKNVIIFLAITASAHITHPFSLSDTWNKTKNKAYSAKENISNKWENLDESTKNAIIGASVATAATAVAAGAGYAGYNAYQKKHYQ
jgi:uncharacterized protein YdhG (YjbR/CyaY superfamily)